MKAKKETKKEKTSPRQARREFYATFEEQSSELLVLNLAHVFGAVSSGGMNYPQANFVASADPITGEVSEEVGGLCWICKSGSFLGGFPPYSGKLKPLTIYRARVRRELPREDGKRRNAYLVTRLSPCRKPPAKLLELRDRLREPVVITEPFGSFTLDRGLSRFDGHIHWLGEHCDVWLSTDERFGSSAEKALATLRKLCADIPGWDSRLRTFAAEQLTECANDWRDDEETEEITPESFAKRITLACIDIDEKGGISVFFDDDGMFASHTICVTGSADGTLESADLWG